MIKRIYITALVALCTTLAAVAQTGTTAFMDKVVEQIMQSEGITAHFTMRGDDESGLSMQGTLKMQGQKFTLQTNDLATWYDGKTMWTYAQVIDEVNVTAPTRQELLEVNPYLLLESYNSLFAVGETPSPIAGERCIVLTPLKRNTNIEQVIITIDTASLKPITFEITSEQDEVYHIAITGYDTTPLPAATFTFDSSQYPDVEVVDLR